MSNTSTCRVQRYWLFCGMPLKKGKEIDKTAALAVALCETPSEQKTEKVLAAYGELVKVTNPVNGRSVLDSEGGGRGRMLSIALVAVALFALATGNFMADSWAAGLGESTQDPSWLGLKNHVWDKLTPFLWGGLRFMRILAQDAAGSGQALRVREAQAQGMGAAHCLGRHSGGDCRDVRAPGFV